ncbi:hypothetical protein SOMG_00033 [Schizosaccharomyces osmophilus]|uniref:Uncharacterized protein n=1 Tax=Schizosaccharomyces osmophilus TaxID=2545709 RepID=A0AAF0AVC2_9SCHI|nr:uncharacterized protein SOMG_00033 [Schizosaccharomyces osmophilus]WBW72392.1 hypothetical protein SOMG_00033 [Schizosaccharomyces osmophilus]
MADGNKCKNCKENDSQPLSKPSFTSDAYPSSQRDCRYTTLSQEDVDYFKSVLAKDGGSIVTDLDESSDPSEFDAFKLTGPKITEESYG